MQDFSDDEIKKILCQTAKIHESKNNSKFSGEDREKEERKLQKEILKWHNIFSSEIEYIKKFSINQIARAGNMSEAYTNNLLKKNCRLSDPHLKRLIKNLKKYEDYFL